MTALYTIHTNQMWNKILLSATEVLMNVSDIKWDGHMIQISAALMGQLKQKNLYSISFSVWSHILLSKSKLMAMDKVIRYPDFRLFIPTSQHFPQKTQLLKHWLFEWKQLKAIKAILPLKAIKLTSL